MQQKERILRPIWCIKCKDFFFGNQEKLGKTNYCPDCKPIFDREFKEFNKQRTQDLNETGRDRL
jgi:hypothetical protein